MAEPRAAKTLRRTRIQQRNEERILNSALEVFSEFGFRGATIDQIAAAAQMSKPNLLYYFRRKEDVHQALIDRLLENWLAPLEAMRANGDPIEEIRNYIHRKMDMAEQFPRESRLFANEIIQGAPHVANFLKTELKALVDEKALVIEGWIQQGRLRKCDPRHLIFSIWSTTQHYADFDVQVCAVLEDDELIKRRFASAKLYLDTLFISALKPE